MDLRPGHVPRARRRGGGPSGLRGDRLPHRAVRRRDRADRGGQSAHRRGARASSSEITIYPAKHFVTPEDEVERAVDGIRKELGERLEVLKGRGQAPRGPAAQLPHRVRPGAAPRGRLLPGDRELLPPPLRAQAGRAALQPPRLLPRGLPRGRRRVPRHRAPDRGHVRGRPLAQGDPGRLRLPPALGARQPAAPLRGVRDDWCSGRSSSPPPRPGTSSTKTARRGGGADHPAHRPRRSRGRGRRPTGPGGGPPGARSR